MGLEKINQWKKERGLTNADLAHLSGVPKSTIDKITSGNTSDPKLETIRAITGALGRTINDLDEKAPGTSSLNMYISTKKVPLVGNVAAGQPIDALENVEDWLTVDEHENVDFALRVKGDSMAGVGIYDGDIVYVQSQPTVNNGEIAVVTTDNGFPDESRATVKRFYQYGKTVLLRPESHNPEYKDQEIELGKGVNVHIQGKVIFLKRHIEGR